MALPDETPVSPMSTWLARLSEPASIRSALTWGAIVAVVFYFVGTGISLLSIAASSGGLDATKNPLLILPACLGLFTFVCALYVAGYMPSAERGHVAPGMLGAVVMLVLSRILAAIYTPQGSVKTPPTSFGVQIVSAVLGISVALALGWLGAFYGVKRNVRQAAQMQQKES